MLVMERRFFVEAKSFCFLAKDRCSDLRLEERRRGFVGFIFVNLHCSSWLVDMMDVASHSQVVEDLALSYREGDKVTMVHEGGNKASRLLEVSVLAEGGRKGVIWLPEGRYGRGWQRFAGELWEVLAFWDKLTGLLDSVVSNSVGNLMGASSSGVTSGWG